MSCSLRWGYRASILTGIVCLLTSVAYAQSYRVYRPVAHVYEEKSFSPHPVLLEVELASVLSAGTVTDKEENAISHNMQGWHARGFFYFSEILAAGAGVGQVQSSDMQTQALTALKRTEWELLLKLILTPRTEPQLYLLLGIGHANQRSRLKRQSRHLDQNSLVWVGGIGGKIRVWKNLSFFADYTLRYDRKKWNNFLFEGPRIRHEGHVGMSYQF